MKGNFLRQTVRHLSISIGGVIVLLILLFVAKGDINRRAETVRGLKETLSSRNQAAESLIRLKKGAEEASNRLRILKNHLPLRDELINFPKEVVNLANRDDVELGFTFGSEIIGEEGLGGLSFSMTLSGNYDNSMKFLRRTEDHPYFIEFDSINLTRKGESSDIFTGVFSGKVFTRNTDEENLQEE